MNLSLILRDVPVKDDLAYRVLHSLCPKRVLYSVDFGIRTSVLDRSRVDAHRKAIEYKLLGLQEVTPFNGASEICPVLPSHWFSGFMVGNLRGFAAGEAFRLFAGVKRVYLDLGVKPNVKAANDMAETLWKLDDGVEVVYITPLALATEPGEKLKVAPFLGQVALEEGLKKASDNGATEVFCGQLSPDDVKNFETITCKSPIESLVFWSAAAAKDLNFPVKEKCEEKAPVVEAESDPRKRMKALYTSIIRKRPTMDSEAIGHVGVNEIVKLHVLKPDATGTAFGKLALSDGGNGYVVVTHHRQEKFTEATHEQ